MSFLRNLFGSKLDGPALAQSDNVQDYAQIDLLGRFDPPRPLHDEREQSAWSRILSRSYEQQIGTMEKQGWLATVGLNYTVTPVGAHVLAIYRARQDREREAAMAKVRSLLAERDTGGALAVRRRYESGQPPIGSAEWTGPEPQLSHSALTRRILFLNHWLLDGLESDVVDWLKMYAAEQHMWGAYWRLTPDQVPAQVQEALATSDLDGVEAAYWRAYQLALFVDNQETWQRCKGGDHVRRLAVVGPDDEHTCDACRTILDQEYLVARAPDLPHRTCTSSRGCRCRYEPVLEMYEDLDL
jgi:hypothetical protein